ncbi:mechanosensitive ion channel MscS-like protein [Babesia gibsoni]|uniref:Mechanosensitive ion channel MscS-like protein n=1 Tax=Babesia gibsoni TaxID=33632 RepID=A0AAD8LPC3_BABGI|nr:mechanosensitive ion channel MscS-like protein [Babesia gibsoni]
MTAEGGSSREDHKTVVYMRTESDELAKEQEEQQNAAISDTDATSQVPPTIDYDDSEDQVIDFSWRHPWNWFKHEFLHDYTALSFLGIHLLLCFICVFFGPMTLPLAHVPKESVDAGIGESAGEAKNASVVINLDMHQLMYIKNIVFFMFVTMVVYMATLLVVMFVRYISVKLLVQPFYNISQMAVVITYAIDPAAAYFVWGILNYWIFRKFIERVRDDNGHDVYRFFLFGRRLSKILVIDHRCYMWANSACHLQILIAMRKLFLSSLLILFEVSFLQNYSSEVKNYLNAQALLRRFNIAWLNFVNKARMSTNPDVMYAFEEAREAINKIPLPETPVVYDNQIYYTADNFKIFRPMIQRWLRKRQTVLDVASRANNLPDVYRSSWIKRCSTNYLINWTAMHYTVHHPPELLFLDYYVPLTSKMAVIEYSQFLFEHIYETMNSLNEVSSQPTKRDSIPSKPDVLSVRQTRAHLDVPIPPMSGRSSFRGPDEHPIRAKSSFHLTRLYTVAMDIDNAEDIEAESTPAPLSAMSFHARDDNRRLTPKMFSSMNSPVIETLFSEYDVSNCGYICANSFTRNVLYMCSMRKRLMSTLRNQRSILNLVRRLLSTVLWFIIFVLYLMTFRVNKNIVLPSTIGFLSAMIVALSYMYTSFITAIIFVVLSNPYNVGDRIRINDGEAMYVKSITTYNTTFRCIHEKIIIYQNSILSTVKITNETRAKHAAHDIAFKVGANTTPAALKQLTQNLKNYVNGKPRVFVKDGCYIYKSEIQVGHYYMIKILLTYIDNWYCPTQIYLLKNEFVIHLAKQCKMLGITYKEANEPISFCGALLYEGDEKLKPSQPLPELTIPPPGQEHRPPIVKH